MMTVVDDMTASFVDEFCVVGKEVSTIAYDYPGVLCVPPRLRHA